MSTVSEGNPKILNPIDITFEDYLEQLRVDPVTSEENALQIELSLVGINACLGRWQSKGEEYHASLLLRVVSGLLDHVYACLVELNSSQPKIYSGLFDEHRRRAVQVSHVEAVVRRWKEKGSSPTTTQFFDDILEEAKQFPNSAEATTLEHGYNSVFVGDTMDRLDSRLLRLSDPDDPMIHSPVLPLVQSLGAGKTRTAIQLSSIRLGLYVNVGPKYPDVASPSGPGQGTLVYDILAGPDGRSMTEFAAAVAVGSWLIAYTEESLAFCQDQADVLFPGRTSRSASALTVDEWTIFVQDMAGVLTDDIVPGFRIRPDVDQTRTPNTNGHHPSSPSRKPRDDLLERIHTRALEVRSTYESARRSDRKIADETALRYFTLQLDPRFKALADFLPVHVPYYFLAIDEAICMGTSRLRLLRKILSGAADLRRNAKFRVLLLDTDSRVSGSAGSIKVDEKLIPKLRLKGGEARIALPFTKFPLDLFLMDDEVARASYYRLLAGQTVGITHAEVVRLMVKMGRPLWNDPYYSQGHLNTEYRYYGIDIAAVRAKMLSCHVYPRTLFADVMTEAGRSRILAIASQRLPLTISDNEGVDGLRDLAEIQIARHLRVVIDVEPKGSWINSYNSSEPMLSLAATDALRRDPDKGWSSVVATIAQGHEKHQLLFGNRGVEFASTMLQYAMDRVAHRLMPATKVSEGDHVVPAHLSFLNVKQVLEELLGSDSFQWTDQAIKWAETHWLNFTHFVPLESHVFERDATSSLLRQAWTRQAAVIGNSGQAGMDLGIPAYCSEEMPNGKELWHSDDIDVIVVQVKNARSMSGVVEADARKDRTLLFVDPPDAGARIRGFNLYLSLASAPEQTLDISDDSMLGFLVYGASKQQFPSMDHLHDWQKGESRSTSLSLFPGRSRSAIESLRYDLEDHRATHERGKFFAMNTQQDAVLDSQVVVTQDETAVIGHASGTTTRQTEDMLQEAAALGDPGSRRPRTASSSDPQDSRKVCSSSIPLRSDKTYTKSGFLSEDSPDGMKRPGRYRNRSADPYIAKQPT